MALKCSFIVNSRNIRDRKRVLRRRKITCPCRQVFVVSAAINENLLLSRFNDQFRWSERGTAAWSIDSQRHDINERNHGRSLHSDENNNKLSSVTGNEGFGHYQRRLAPCHGIHIQIIHKRFAVDSYRENAETSAAVF